MEPTLINYWPLIGVLAVVVGFVLRLNPALVVVVAGFITGLAANLSPLEVLDILGKAFTDKRFLLLFLIALPVIGLLERHGLKEHAQAWIARLRGATTARLLVAYLLMRQVSSAAGLTSLGGHPQAVRPLVAPMAEAAAEITHGDLPRPAQLDQWVERVERHTHLHDNFKALIGAFPTNAHPMAVLSSAVSVTA